MMLPFLRDDENQSRMAGESDSQRMELTDMSYTMTIEAPEKAAWFERQRAKLSAAELGELFVLFLSERMAKEKADEKNPFEAFCGTWDDAQFAEFQNATQRSVNPADWQ